MSNKKTGDFIKSLLKSKGMNQEDLAKALNITPQAVSKSLSGVNTFDIINLKTISELFKVTIDDIINGELQTSTSFMTDQERIVKLGLNAISNADVKLLTTWDEKERSILHYAIENGDPEIIKHILSKGYFKKTYSILIDNHNHLKNNIVKIMMENQLVEELIQFFNYTDIKFSSISSNYSNCINDCKELWTTQNDKLINLIYFNNKSNGSDRFFNLDLAIRYDNKKALTLWSKWIPSANIRWDKLPGLSEGVEYCNLDFLKLLFEVIENNDALKRIKASVNAVEVYNLSKEIFDFLLDESLKNRTQDIGRFNTQKFNQLKIQGLDQLLLMLFKAGEYEEIEKYKKYGEFQPSFLNDIDIADMDIKDLMYLFEKGSMPSVVYNDHSSVQNYVLIMNKILLKLTSEVIKLKNSAK